MQKRRTIGETIRAERKALKWSQVKLAQKIYVTPPTIARWEKDGGTPDLLSCIGLAELFGCSIDYLAGLTDNRAIKR